jgi:DNA-binding TFAR19-related protein (PDSD5 family)
MSEHDQDQHELEKIRMKKLKEIMEAKKRNEATQKRVISISEKIDYILRVVLSQEAYNHLINLKNNEPNIYQAIYHELISPDVIQNIDYLLAIIRSRGGVPRQIPLDAIIYLERKAKGIKSKIQVQRGDDFMDLGSFLSK